MPDGDQAQILTVTAGGVWLDGLRREVQASTTLYFNPEGEANSGSVTGIWCRVPASAPAGTKGVRRRTAPKRCPTDYSRSFAWPGSGGFGERVVTGLSRRPYPAPDRERASTTVLARSSGDAGATFGAAFASAA